MKTALVTGASSGFGLELAKKLLQNDWEVIALVRSAGPLAEMAASAARTDRRLRLYQADLSDFKRLKSTLAEVRSKEGQIDILFNNAGVMLEGPKPSPQGRDLHFEVNAVVPYILIQELKAQLLSSERKTVVNTSSITLSMVKNFDLDGLEHPRSFKKIFGPYAASKLALSLWSSELAKSMKSEGMEIRDICPGSAKTAMTAGGGLPWWLKPVRQLVFPSPAKGAEMILQAGVGHFRGQTGIFISKGKVIPLRFQSFAPAILAKVEAIYRESFQRA